MQRRFLVPQILTDVAQIQPKISAVAPHPYPVAPSINQSLNCIRISPRFTREWGASVCMRIKLRTSQFLTLDSVLHCKSCIRENRLLRYLENIRGSLSQGFCLDGMVCARVGVGTWGGMECREENNIRTLGRRLMRLHVKGITTSRQAFIGSLI